MNVHETGRPGEPKALMDRTETRLELTALRAEIIDSILTRGIKPSRALREEGIRHLASVDRVPMELVVGRIISSSSELRDQSSLDLHLYGSSRSIFPVLVEREHERELFWTNQWLNQNGFELAERRMAASFLIVCRAGALSEDRYSTGRTVSPTLFAYIVLPEAISNEHLGPEADKHGSGVTIKIVRRTIKRVIKLDGEEHLLIVPDYEKSLIEILDELYNKAWVHGVRLPTEEDIERLATSTPLATG